MQVLRIAAINAYLFLLNIPVKITQKENKIDITDMYTTLYSISQKLRLGLQTVLIQNV